MLSVAVFIVSCISHLFYFHDNSDDSNISQKLLFIPAEFFFLIWLSICVSTIQPKRLLLAWKTVSRMTCDQLHVMLDAGISTVIPRTSASETGSV